MFILGHVGISVAAGHAIDGRADLRRVAVASLLPDLIDKPLLFLAPGFVHGWSRSVGHSLLGLGVFALLATAGWRRAALPLVAAYALHIALDRMWEDSHILTWPLQGFWFPPYALDHRELWWQKFSDLWTLSGEAIGGAILASFAARGRLWERGRLRAFLATGRIAEPLDLPLSGAD